VTRRTRLVCSSVPGKWSARDVPELGWAESACSGVWGMMVSKRGFGVGGGVVWFYG
jgi:hypothetical protein